MTASVDRIRGLSSSLAMKAPVLCATTGPITLEGLQTIDGVAPLLAGSRVLVKEQANPAQNGIYEANTSEWQRAPDFNKSNDITQGTSVYVQQGTVNGGVWFQVTTASPVPGSALVFEIGVLSASVSVSADTVWYTPPGTGAVVRSVQSKLREFVSVFDFLTEADILVVQNYSFSIDLSAKIQLAIYAAFAANQDLFLPAGGYKASGLILPGSLSPDTRSKSFRLYGQGCGIPFSTAYSGSTVIQSLTDEPILTDAVTGSSGGATINFTIDGIKFDGTSTTPVVLINSMYGVSEFHHNTIYQRGDGDGFKMLYGATCHIHDCYSFNTDFVSFYLGDARTGVGFNFINNHASGLVTFSKCSARGFKDGFVLSGEDSGSSAYSVALRDFECSVVYNGVTIGPYVAGGIVESGYFEGGDGGTAIKVLSSRITISNNRIYSGFSVGIDAGSTSFLGGVTIENNSINLGDKVNAIGIWTESTGNTRNQTISGNSITSTVGTEGVIGIKLTGADPRVTIVGNYFEPGTAWSGSGALKLQDLSGGGALGIIQKELGNSEIMSLSRVELSLEQYPSALTESNVTTNILTLPNAGSMFVVSATVATLINRLAAGKTSGRVVIFRTTTANASFTNSAYIKTAGGATFTGPGMIIFYINYIGSSSYAYEISRTTF